MKKTYGAMALLGALALGLGIGATSLSAEPAGAYYAGEEDTFRLWVNRSNDGLNSEIYTWFVTDEYGTFPHCYGKSVIGEEDNGLLYFDLPVSAIGQKLVFYPYDGEAWLYTTAEFSYTSGDNAWVWQIVYEDGSYSMKQMESATSDGGLVTVSVIEEVLEAYYTCSESKDNGYGNFGQVYDTWIDGMIGSDYLSISSTQDYSDKTDYENGSKTVQVTLQAKIDYMLAEYNSLEEASGSILSAFADDSRWALAAIASLLAVGVAGFGAYLVYSRRKRA